MISLFDDLSTAARQGVHFARHQFWNARRALKGEEVMTPPFIAGTTDKEDVRRARKWLKKPEEWYDQSVVQNFEKGFADWNGSECAVSLMGGRVALSAVIEALGLEAGDEVIIPGYTCVVVPNSFHYAGVKVVYADIELDTYGPDVEAFASAVTDRTSAILIHHLYGLVCRDYEALLDLADQHNLYVIEDCTHATGAKYRGERVGNLGDAAIYSSEHSKCFSTVQGGIAVTNDNRIAEGLRKYAEEAVFPRGRRVERLLHTFILDYYTQSDPQRWWWRELYQFRYGEEKLISTTDLEKRGEKPPHYGQRMPAPLADIGLGQLEKLESYNRRRRQNAGSWTTWCNENGYRSPTIIQDSEPVWLRYPVIVDPEEKKDVSWTRGELGVDAGVWFRTNIHPVEQAVDGCPRADEAVSRCINLPTLMK